MAVWELYSQMFWKKTCHQSGNYYVSYIGDCTGQNLKPCVNKSPAVTFIKIINTYNITYIYYDLQENKLPRHVHQ